MDRLDIKLIGQLARGMSSQDFQPDVKGVYGRIARNLGVDEDTIRNRVDRLESSGVINGWKLFVNPNALGLKLFVLWMVVGPRLSIDEAVRKIRLVHGVISIVREVGDVLGVALLCENEQVFKKRAGLISELLGTPKELATHSVDLPRTDVELTQGDWEVIQAFRPNPLIRYSEAAGDLGLSSRTVQRRLRRLIEANAVFFFPNIDYGRLEGASCVDVFVSYSSSQHKKQVERSIFTKFEDYVLRAGWGSDSYGHFEFLIPNVKVAQEIVDWARSLEGVRDVTLYFVFDWLVYYDDALEEIMKMRVAPENPKR